MSDLLNKVHLLSNHINHLSDPADPLWAAPSPHYSMIDLSRPRLDVALLQSVAKIDWSDWLVCGIIAAFWHSPSPSSRTRPKGVAVKLQTIQSKCLRTITGAYRATPVRTLETETFIPPLDLYLDGRVEAYHNRTRHSRTKEITEEACWLIQRCTRRPRLTAAAPLAVREELATDRYQDGSKVPEPKQGTRLKNTDGYCGISPILCVVTHSLPSPSWIVSETLKNKIDMTFNLYQFNSSLQILSPHSQDKRPKIACYTCPPHRPGWEQQVARLPAFL